MNGQRRSGRDGEVERRLDAFARARLSPSAAATIRMRSRVMAEAHRPSRAAGSAADVEAVRSVRAAVVPFHSHRSLLAAAVAASLLILALAAAAFAQRPGGPLYEVRLAIEEAFLPAEADARAAADLRRLEARLAEAREAVASGDQAAIAAALAAYREVIDGADATVGGSDVRDAQLEEALERHLVVLNELLARVPAQARPAIERAIERSDRAVERINEGGQPGPADPLPNGPTKEPPGQSGRPDRTPPGPPPDRPGASN